VTVVHAIATAHFDVRPHPDTNAASDSATPDSFA